MDLKRPFATLENSKQESQIVQSALHALCSRGLLETENYDARLYQITQSAMQRALDIPWSALTPRMQRLIYAINAIHQPQVMIAAGIFCGFTFLVNASAAIGPGAVYRARALIGIEIDPKVAEHSARNVRAFDTSDSARIVNGDAISFCLDWPDRIDLLYLDADGSAGRGKAIYSEILEAAWTKLAPDALILAHNSLNAARQMRGYLDFVRNPRNCRASLSIAFDAEGLEVSIR